MNNGNIAGALYSVCGKQMVSQAQVHAGGVHF